PDGRISAADLLSAQVDLPPWPAGAAGSCIADNVQLLDGRTGRVPDPASLMRLLYADVDGDGVDESVAILGCRPGESPFQQVAVFDRDEDGRIVTLGQVFRTESLQAYTGKASWIADVQPDTAGRIRVQVGDAPQTDGPARKWVQKQWRTYGWTGSGFAQVAGPTRFDPNPLFTDLRVTATDVVFVDQSPTELGWRDGSVTVTVRNTGPTDAETVELTLEFGTAKMRRTAAGWESCSTVDQRTGTLFGSVRCRLGPIRAGAQRTLKLGLENSEPQPDEGVAHVTVGRPDSANGYIPDLSFRDNSASFDFH
ncbi:hypothetical protein ACFQ0D_34485, partial [Micromonospora zhanjiangensis]